MLKVFCVKRILLCFYHFTERKMLEYFHMFEVIFLGKPFCQALSWAASRGHGRVVRILLDHQADSKIFSNDGQTPSDIAYSSDFPRVKVISE